MFVDFGDRSSHDAAKINKSTGAVFDYQVSPFEFVILAIKGNHFLTIFTFTDSEFLSGQFVQVKNVTR